MSEFSGYSNIIHKKIADWVFGLLKEGEEHRKTGVRKKNYGGGDVRHTIQSYGWVYEDLRQALINKDPVYAANQKIVDDIKKESAQ